MAGGKGNIQRKIYTSKTFHILIHLIQTFNQLNFRYSITYRATSIICMEGNQIKFSIKLI